MNSRPAQPLYFGAPDAPLFGWWHSAEMATGLAMVLCGPFGREEISAHRSLLHLADMLAQRGVPTLRFDYPGSGDSSGDSLDPGQLRAWGDSLHCAIDEVRRLAGVPRVALAGLRVGALLATQAALARDDVAALVAVVPVVNGRTWIRELKALQAASASDAVGSEEGVFESGGFAMSAATRDALCQLDLRAPSRAPASDILILDRDDLPAHSAWADQLASLGARVERRELPGYAQLMLDPHRAEVPWSMWEAICAWIRPLAVQAVPGASPGPVAMRNAASFSGIRESAQLVATEGGHLHAIETEPLETAASGHAIVLLNAGATRRIGPGRLYVELARRCALQGHRVIRVDLSGLGDSPAIAGCDENIVYSDSALREVRSVVEYLRTRSDVRRCSSIGLCAGAYHGFKAAVIGVPLDAVVVINPLTFFWHAGMPLDAPMPDHVVISEMARYMRDPFSTDRWLRLLKGGGDMRRVSTFLGKWLSSKVTAPARELARQLRIPLNDDLAGELALLAERNVKMQFAFAANEPGEQLLKAQGGRIVGRLQQSGTIEIRHLDTADHIFSRLAPRRDLVDALVKAFVSVAADDADSRESTMAAVPARASASPGVPARQSSG